jgi:hypothetical protein
MVTKRRHERFAGNTANHCIREALDGIVRYVEQGCAQTEEIAGRYEAEDLPASIGKEFVANGPPADEKKQMPTDVPLDYDVLLGPNFGSVDEQFLQDLFVAFVELDEDPEFSIHVVADIGDRLPNPGHRFLPFAMPN